MEVHEAIRQRFSVRAYQDRPIEDDKLGRVLEAARMAPTARNRQEWKLVVAREVGLRAALAAAADQPFIAQAPVVLALVGLTPDAAMHCRVPTDPVDGSIVLDHITLAAVAEGLGTCWIGHFEQDACCELLAVPPTAKIIQLMPLGYPTIERPTPKRKALGELICYDRLS